MRNPIMTVITQAEPIIDPRDFGNALDRVASALFYLAERAGLLPEGRRVAVRLLPAKDSAPAVAVGSLTCRNADLVEPTC